MRIEDSLTDIRVDTYIYTVVGDVVQAIEISTVTVS